MPTPSTAVAGEAADDDVEDCNDAVDYGHYDFRRALARCVCEGVVEGFGLLDPMALTTAMMQRPARVKSQL